MRIFARLQTRLIPQFAIVSTALVAGTLFATTPAVAQSAPQPAATQSTQRPPVKAHQHKKPSPIPAPVAQTPPPPPMPHWPVNDTPSPAAVVWDATGLRISASNSSLQQILKEVSTETGSKVEGLGGDQRVYGNYGPGQARDVLSQLLQGSGYNVLLAGDLGQGAPRQIVLTPRRSGSPANPQNGMNRGEGQPQQDPDEDIPEDQPPPEEQPQLPQPQQGQPQPQMQNNQPGFGPNGPVRTPQQVMEEMQQRQLQQQQQQQQQQNPQE